MLDEVKLYLKIDNDEDDNLLKSLIESAKVYLINAGCKIYEENDLLKLAINLLVGHWYENREVMGKADKLAFSLESIIIQLKYSYEVSI
ncbi:TPA: phage gp6-like head-tail connector protein [Clostridioides difficile]|nr:phage gp6-like head-tail connector protein [Clostridioides difficile]MCK3739380.1 head-tail connector protein [Clostridioides difficile]HBF0961167.1 phage gp6-like head-tail connector protein [Clostridioides difficile]HBF6761854.1 phage gp6-like head-tail connector protein [Clostridioides difficile]HBF9352581.1 phage gp6-like head-tail connector protein [Clostridioides difficile]